MVQDTGNVTWVDKIPSLYFLMNCDSNATEVVQFELHEDVAMYKKRPTPS